MQRVSAYSERGGYSTITAGIASSPTRVQRTFLAATVAVYDYGTTNLVNIWSDRAGTISTANPLTTSGTTGAFGFWIPNGTYDLAFSGTVASNFTITITVSGELGETDASLYASLAAAVTAIGSTPTNLVISTALFPGGASCTVPATLRLVFRGAGTLQLTTSNTYIIRSDSVDWPIKKLFYNATAGQGVLSLSGNQVITEVWTEWFGGGAGIAATANTAAAQAASNALVSLVGGNVSFGNGALRFGGGEYSFNSLWTIGSTTGGGDGLGSFTGISLVGTNGLVGTTFNWTGSTGGQMIKVYRGRYVYVRGIKFNNSVVKGTTIGLWFSGAPASGEQTSNVLAELCNFSSFNVGTQAGDVGGSAAGEITYLNCIFQSNNKGYLGASSGNSLVNRFINCSGYGNAQAAIDLGVGSGDTHIAGGGFSSNGSDVDLTTGDIRLNLGWNGTVHIQDARFELSNEVGAGGGILNASSFGSVAIDNCRFAAPTVPTYACIRGAGNWAVDSCRFGGDAETSWIPYDTGANNAGGTYRVTNSAIQNTSILTYNTGGNGDVGLRLWAEGNYSISSGIVTKLDDLIPGLIGQTPGGTSVLIGTQRVNSYGQVSTDVYLWTNQDATPSAKWAKLFKTQNSAGTTYTNFLDGVEGQTISVFVNDANTTFKNNTTIVTRTGSDVTATNGLTYSFTFTSSKWRML